MSEFNKVETVEDLNKLDDTEMVSGYLAGFKNDAEPGSDKSKSFWHGWRNGMIDGGYMHKDDSSSKLAREFVGKYKGYH